jgi:short-subunit dehydrogenase
VSPTPQQPWSSALVTGASAGIGDAFARQLAAAGTDLVLVARRAERLEQLAEELRAGGVEVDVVAADLTDRADVGRVAERLTDADRPVDLLVNCAGLGAAGPFADGDLDRYHQIVDLNVTALVDLTHAALGAMQARDRGWILNVSSLGGHAPGPKFAVYSATKAFVTSFSESLFEELRGTRVHVTVVCPGATKTEFGAIAGTEADDLPALLQQSADEVVAEALAATAAGKAVKVTGVINRVSATFSDLLPRVANRRLSALVTDRL